MTRRPILPTKPSVHQIFPRPSKVSRCGVVLEVRDLVRYSSMALELKAPEGGGVNLPMCETELLFSVNQIEPVLGSGPTMPYGLLAGVGVGTSVNSWVDGLNLPMLLTLNSVNQRLPDQSKVRSYGAAL